jgi:hypothetical protein
VRASDETGRGAIPKNGRVGEVDAEVKMSCECRERSFFLTTYVGAGDESLVSPSPYFADEVVHMVRSLRAAAGHESFSNCIIPARRRDDIGAGKLLRNNFFFLFSFFHEIPRYLERKGSRH